MEMGMGNGNGAGSCLLIIIIYYKQHFITFWRLLYVYIYHCPSVHLSICLSVFIAASEVGVIIMNIKYFISFSFAQWLGSFGIFCCLRNGLCFLVLLVVALVVVVAVVVVAVAFVFPIVLHINFAKAFFDLADKFACVMIHRAIFGQSLDPQQITNNKQQKASVWKMPVKVFATLADTFFLTPSLSDSLKCSSTNCWTVIEIW